MNERLQAVKGLLGQLRLTTLRHGVEDQLLAAARDNQSSLEFLYEALRLEVEGRSNNSRDRRLKLAAFPYHRTVDDFDFGFQTSVNPRQIRQLMDMTWLEKAFNLVFLWASRGRKNPLGHSAWHPSSRTWLLGRFRPRYPHHLTRQYLAELPTALMGTEVRKTC